MVTGGFKTRAQAVEAVWNGTADLIGLARSLILDPNLPHRWQKEAFAQQADIQFPRFASPPEGGITAWYTMRLTELGEDREGKHSDLQTAVAAYDKRDAERVDRWRARFSD